MVLRRDRAMTAVAVVLDVAFHAGRRGAVSAAEIAERCGQSRRGIEPLLQALSRAGLLDSVRGPHGGYRLGRPRRDLRVADIVAVAAEVEASAVPAAGLLGAVVEPLWAELEAGVEQQLRRLNIDELLRRAAAAGWQSAVEPLDFTI